MRRLMMGGKIMERETVRWKLLFRVADTQGNANFNYGANKCVIHLYDEA